MKFEKQVMVVQKTSDGYSDSEGIEMVPMPFLIGPIKKRHTI